MALNTIITVAWKYIYFVIKLLLLSIALGVPFIFLVYIFKNRFQRSKKSFIWKMAIITYLVSLVVVLLLYFIPVLKVGMDLTFLQYVLFIFLHVLMLAIVNLLITGVVIIFALIATAIYDALVEKANKSKKDKKDKDKSKNEIYFIKLWISLTLTMIILFIVYLIFPKLIAMLLYLIYLF